jgi:hypothetical protein
MLKRITKPTIDDPRSEIATANSFIKFVGTGWETVKRHIVWTKSKTGHARFVSAADSVYFSLYGSVKALDLCCRVGHSSTTRAKTGGKAITLPLVDPKLCPDCGFCLYAVQALEARGFEPLTSSLQSWRSTN